MWSDLRNLRWSAIDAAGFLRVLMQKTQREAEIPISSACREALRVCRTRPAVASVYVFVDEEGRQYTPERLRRAFRLAKELAGITRRFRPHDLRHTFGCRLADQNISLQKIAKFDPLSFMVWWTSLAN